MSGRGAIRLHVAIQLLGALVLLVAVNVVSFEFYWREDFSRSRKFVLSDQTKRVLRDLARPVEVTVFFSRTAVSPASALYPDVNALLEELVFSGRDKVRVEHVDPVRDMTRAREVQARYKFRADENLLVLEYEGRVAFLPVDQMADFDFGPVAAGGSPRVLAFKGEQAFTSALIGLVSPEERKVYFLQGHGEPVPGPGSPISTFSGYIERQNVMPSALALGAVDSIPSDAAAVFIVGAQFDPNPREIGMLSNYWQGGGNLMVLLDPAARTPELDAFLAGAGLRPRGDRVLRTVRLGFATGILREVTAEFSPESPVTKRLTGMTLFLPGATQSIALEPPEDRRISLRPLLQPLEEFWGEVDHVTDARTGVRYDDGRDAGQPLYVGASASRGGGDAVSIDSGKLIVVGNSEFVLDAAISQPGLDFLVSATHWLLERGRLAGVAPKSRRYFALRLNDRELGMLSGLALLAMPLAAALVAVALWWRRRS